MVAVLSGAAWGCGGGDDRAPSDPAPTIEPSTSTTVGTTTTTTTTAPRSKLVKVQVDTDLPRQDIDVNVRHPRTFTPEQAEVVKTWANYRHLQAVNRHTPDPSAALLERYVTPDFVAGVRAEASGIDASVSIRTVEPPRLRETVSSVAIDGSRAVLTTCRIARDVRIRVSDGETISDQVGTSSSRSRLERQNGRWLVTAAPDFDNRMGEGEDESLCL